MYENQLQPPAQVLERASASYPLKTVLLQTSANTDGFLSDHKKPTQADLKMAVCN